MANKEFTQDEMNLLIKNPYVNNVTPQTISFSLEFKYLALKELRAGKRGRQIFEDAGIPVELIGIQRVYSIMKRIKQEAQSPEGLREAYSKAKQARMEAFEKKNLAEVQTKAAIKELQDKIIHLEQTIEFLKKTQSLLTK